MSVHQEKGFPQNRLDYHFDLGLPVSRTVRSICCLSQLVCGILLQWPELSNIPRNFIYHNKSHATPLSLPFPGHYLVPSYAYFFLIVFNNYWHTIFLLVYLIINYFLFLYSGLQEVRDMFF